MDDDVFDYARALVRRGGFLLRRVVSVGGARAVVAADCRIIEYGSAATAFDLLEAADPYVELPSEWRDRVGAAMRQDASPGCHLAPYRPPA